jgi:hypothetical protein
LLPITQQGRASLKKWLLAGAAPELISSTRDPVRSRTFLFNALSRPQGASYLANLVTGMDCYLTATEDHLDTISQTDDIDASLGALGKVWWIDD